MNFGILGATEVRDEARRLELPTGRARSLLALLILHVGEPVAAERIIDELWGEDPPRTAGTVVQGLISRLRRALEPGRAKAGPSAILKTAGTGYCLVVAPESVDANRFKGLLDRARGATLEERPEILADALSMWRGPALADFTYEPFAQRAIAALEELRTQAIEDRVEAELSLRRGGDLVAELEEVIAANPFRERLRGFVMLALYRAGRRGRSRGLPQDTLAVRGGVGARTWPWAAPARGGDFSRRPRARAEAPDSNRGAAAHSALSLASARTADGCGRRRRCHADRGPGVGPGGARTTRCACGPCRVRCARASRRASRATPRRHVDGVLRLPSCVRRRCAASSSRSARCAHRDIRAGRRSVIR